MGKDDETPPIRVHATLWELSPHGRTALKNLVGRRWPGADRFNVRSINLLEEGVPCPLDLDSRAALASNSGPGWAWVVHAIGTPPPLLEVGFEHDGGCVCLDGGAAGMLYREDGL
jgi:hypothetical protein